MELRQRFINLLGTRRLRTLPPKSWGWYSTHYPICPAFSRREELNVNGTSGKEPGRSGADLRYHRRNICSVYLSIRKDGGSFLVLELEIFLAKDTQRATGHYPRGNYQILSYSCHVTIHSGSWFSHKLWGSTLNVVATFN
jgi:hypothetical protein